MLADLKVPGFCCFFPCFLLVPLRIDDFRVILVSFLLKIQPLCTEIQGFLDFKTCFWVHGLFQNFIFHQAAERHRGKHGEVQYRR